MPTMKHSSLLLAAALLGGTVSAQGDFSFQKSSPATFGTTLKLDYTGAPASKPLMFMLSSNGGPTPLQLLFGGSDPRSLEVGVDLISTWLLIATTPTGNGNFSLPVPNLASLQGAHLHVQLMTGGGSGPNLVDKISEKVVVVPGARSTSDLLQSQLGDGRTPAGTGRALMTVSPIGDGKFLLAGGGTGNILGAQGLKTTEIFDAATLTSGPGPDMMIERALHSATVLKDGRVLIVGGVDGGNSTTSGDPVNSCEIYDPNTNTFTPTGSMAEARAGHGAALLNDGRVLVVAGTKELSDVTQVITGILNTCEVYDPASGTWSSTSAISDRVIGPSLTTLQNGQVLVAGGAKINTIFGIPTSVSSISTAKLYTPSSGNWSNAASMRQDRAVHTYNTILLADGRVLVTGGVEVQIPLIPIPQNFNGAQSTDRAEIYNPANNTWTSIPNLPTERFGHSATQMPNGNILLVGGGRGAIDAAVSVNNVDEIDPSGTLLGSFTLRTARGTHGACLLPDGTLAVAGGTTSATATSTLRSMEILRQ